MSDHPQLGDVAHGDLLILPAPIDTMQDGPIQIVQAYFGEHGTSPNLQALIVDQNLQVIKTRVTQHDLRGARPLSHSNIRFLDRSIYDLAKREALVEMLDAPRKDQSSSIDI